MRSRLTSPLALTFFAVGLFAAQVLLACTFTGVATALPCGPVIEPTCASADVAAIASAEAPNGRVGLANHSVPTALPARSSPQGSLGATAGPGARAAAVPLFTLHSVLLV